MDSHSLQAELADPVQSIGMQYYFDPATAAAAAPLGLNVFEFYGVGRGGVLATSDPQEVAAAFWFFHDNAMNFLYTAASQKVEVPAVVAAHLEAAYAYADGKFSSVSTDVVTAYAAAARKAIDAVPTGQYALFDGYRTQPVPSNPLHAAYLATILLRELRGGVHIDSTRAYGISANEACFIYDESIFKLHGYSDADAPERTDELVQKMLEAEELTSATMSRYLGVLDVDQMRALSAGVAAFADCLAEG
jgi:hypothetical protein